MYTQTMNRLLNKLNAKINFESLPFLFVIEGVSLICSSLGMAPNEGKTVKLHKRPQTRSCTRVYVTRNHFTKQ